MIIAENALKPDEIWIADSASPARVVLNTVDTITAGGPVVVIVVPDGDDRASLLDDLDRGLAAAQARTIRIGGSDQDPITLRRAMSQVVGDGGMDEPDPIERFFNALTVPAGDERHVVLLVWGADRLAGDMIGYLRLVMSTFSVGPLPLQTVLVGHDETWAYIQANGGLPHGDMPPRFLLYPDVNTCEYEADAAVLDQTNPGPPDPPDLPVLMDTPEPPVAAAIPSEPVVAPPVVEPGLADMATEPETASQVEVPPAQPVDTPAEPVASRASRFEPVQGWVPNPARPRQRKGRWIAIGAGFAVAVGTGLTWHYQARLRETYWQVEASGWASVAALTASPGEETTAGDSPPASSPVTLAEAVVSANTEGEPGAEPATPSVHLPIYSTSQPSPPLATPSFATPPSSTPIAAQPVVSEPGPTQQVGPQVTTSGGPDARPVNGPAPPIPATTPGEIRDAVAKSDPEPVQVPAPDPAAAARQEPPKEVPTITATEARSPSSAIGAIPAEPAATPPAPITTAVPTTTRTPPAQPSPTPASPTPASPTPASPARGSRINPTAEPVAEPQPGLAAKATPTPRPQAPPKRAEPATVSPAAIRAMLSRGQELLSNNDIVGARFMFERAAAAGSAEAALMAGVSYDPASLAPMGPHRRTLADPVAAATWYRLALRLGDPRAADLLSRLETPDPRR